MTVFFTHVEPDRLGDVIETIVAFIEGLLGRRFAAAEREERLKFALTAIVDELRR